MTEKSTKKLNIAMVCDPVTDCVAGSFISTLRFAEILSARGHKIIFIAAKSPKNNDDNYYKNIKVYRFFSLLLPKSEKQFYISFPIISQIKKILVNEKIDILHAIIPTPSAVVSMRAAKELGIKIVAHSHTQPENIFLHLPKIIGQNKINKLFYKYLSWIYNKAEAIIYPTEFAKKLFEKLNPSKKMVIISNGVDTKKFAPIDPKPFFDKFNLDKNKKNILYVGRLHPEKSVDTLIKALPLILKESPDAYLMIVGFGHLGEKLEALAWKLGIEKNITFFGRLTDEELVMAYNSCEVFVLPSLAELEGMVVLEAMGCGKPIIIADAKNSASTYFVNNNGLLFKPEDHRDLAKQVTKILNDDELRKTMSDKSLKQSRNYDINNSANRLEDLYNSLL